MTFASGVILSLAYIFGLLSATSDWGKYGILVLGVATAIIQRRFWRTGSRPRLWIAAGIVGLLASLYFQARMPQPAVNDISKFVPLKEVNEVRYQEQVVTVQGTIASVPCLTRNGRSQFLLKATQFNEIEGSKDKPADITKKVTGKLYVSVPLLQATGLYPGQAIAVTGVLYKPKSATHLKSFNFQNYLSHEGIFASLKGRQVTIVDETVSRWRWEIIQQRIIRSHVKGAGVPEGLLISGMVLGNRVTNIPFNLTDSFVQTGLIYALAASGFQVSLIVGLVWILTGRLSVRAQFSFGIIALLILIGLAGPQPPLLRAVVMGIGLLIALVQRRKVKPWGSLLVAATILLLFDPLLIWNLGFQFSFLIMIGVLVTAIPLIKKLVWLPPVIAILIAIPLSAYLWTLPLQVYAFGLVSLYSIVVNIISAVPLSIISISAFISAIASAIWPLAGSCLAWVLYYPTHWLIIVVEFFIQLPRNSFAVGTISPLQLMMFYGLIGIVWWHNWRQRQWWIAGVVAVSLIIIPVWEAKATLFKVTVMPTSGDSVLVIQEGGRVTLINSGNTNTASFTVLPFLQQQGINQIDWAVSVDSHPSSKIGWPQILERLHVKTLYVNVTSKENLGVRDREKENTSKKNLLSAQSSTFGLYAKDSSAGVQAIVSAALSQQVDYQPLPVDQTLSIGSITIKLISTAPPVLQLQIRDRLWLLLGNLNSSDDPMSLRPLTSDKLAIAKLLPRASVLCGSGELLTADILKVVQPEVAIASSSTVEPDTKSEFPKSKRLYWTGRDGAIQWTPGAEFETSLETGENDASLL